MCLTMNKDWILCGEADNGRAAIAMVRRVKPDVLLLDYAMPEMNGLEAAREIIAAGSCTRILILSVHDTSDVLEQVLDSGAMGYVLKSDAMRELIAAVDAVRSNKTFFTAKIAQSVLERHMKRMGENTRHRPSVVKKTKHAGTQ